MNLAQRVSKICAALFASKRAGTNLQTKSVKKNEIPQKGQFNIMVGYIENFFGYKKMGIKKGSFYTAPFSCYQNFLISLRTFATENSKRATATIKPMKLVMFA